MVGELVVLAHAAEQPALFVTADPAASIQPSSYFTKLWQGTS